MSLDVMEAVFAPGMRYWREYQEFQKSRSISVPALDKGPQPGRVHVDLDTGQVIIEPQLGSGDEPDPPSHPR